MVAVRLVLVACFSVAPLSTASGAATAATPISKVLELMGEMAVKGRAAKEDEATRFSAFAQWCGDQTRIKTGEIEDGNQKITELKAEIEKAAATIRSLTERIEELDEDVARWKKDQKSASQVRDRETIDFKATVADYSESLDALSQAITVLQEQAHNRPQAELVQALLQVRSKRLVPDATKSALAAFLQEPEGLDYEAPEANAYDFQSSGIVSMLEKLEADFAAKKTNLEKEELNSQHGFGQIMQQLTDDIENAEHEVEKKTAVRAETENSKAQSEGDLAQTVSDRNSDQKYLDEMTNMCNQKKTDFESRQQLRAEELEALAKAMEIISSGAVAGVAEQQLPALPQVSTALVFLRTEQRSPVQDKIAMFLAERARSTGSRLLTAASEECANSPFGKVKKMIKQLILKLMEEATAETEHKGWCDTELVTNKQVRDRKTRDVEGLSSDVEDLTAAILDLTQDIADLATAVKELDEAMASATAERTESKAKNEETIADAKGAQIAVGEAMAVLKDFYAKSAQATALEQQAMALVQQSPDEDAPETFEKPYTGMLPEGGGILDFLEVIQSDFARLESETTSGEAMEADEYKNFMFTSEKDKALKENENKHKGEKKTEKESALHSAKEELKLTQEQLDKALAYYEKLKPTCVDSGISYEERVKRREEEIQSLQEALKILAGEDAA